MRPARTQARIGDSLRKAREFEKDYPLGRPFVQVVCDVPRPAQPLATFEDVMAFVADQEKTCTPSR